MFCAAANLQELAVAGTSGSEQGIAALLTAACKSKQLHLLDVRGLPLAGKVGQLLMTNSSNAPYSCRLQILCAATACAMPSSARSKKCHSHVCMCVYVRLHVTCRLLMPCASC
jgi:hypothetical protein